MKDCLFCKIIKGEIPSTRVYEDDDMIVINDIDPKAPKHYLLIVKEHYKLLSEQNLEQSRKLGLCLHKISQLQHELGLDGGYRLVINQGDNAGQSVHHLHVHVLGGKKMEWNPA